MHEIPGMPRRVTLAVLVGLLSSVPASPFGKNKVQYQRYQWRYLETPRYRVYFHREQGDLPRISAAWAEQYYRGFREAFGFTHSRRVPLLVYGTPNQFQQTNVILELLPEGVGGFTELFKNRVVIPFNGSYEEYRHVLHHELVHAFQFGILYDHPGGAFLRGTSRQMPMWFAEGLAEYLSSGWDIEADMFLMDRTIFSQVPPPGPMLGGYMAYKGGQSFLFFLASTRGQEAFSRFLRSFRDTRNVTMSIKEVYDETLEDVGKEWLKELKRLYWPEIGTREDPVSIAVALTSHVEDKNNFNLRPRISPDGEKIAFFSDRKDYTRIVISDRDGETVTEISQYGYGGYFESFHPFRSGVCWGPDSKRLAFVTKEDGSDHIRIVDIMSRKVLRNIDPQLGSVVSPDWSHDGTRLVFSGISGHRSDLYLYDLQQDSLQRLTTSILHESDPMFSPQGDGIVFAGRDSSGQFFRESPWKARPSSDLFYLDLSTGEQRRLTRHEADEKQACFSPDGSRLLYVSNRNGIDNLYMAPFSSPDSATAVTNILGGCSDPDWARGDDVVAFCLFQKQGWDIWLMEDPVDKRKDVPPAPTKWAATLRDTTLKFFDPPRNVQAESESDSDTAADSLSDSAAVESAAITDTTIETIGEEPDVDAFSTVQSPQADSTPRDSITTGAAQSAEADSATEDTAVVSTESYLPSYRYRPVFSPDMVSVGVGINTLYGYAGQGYVVLSDILGNHRITLAGDVQGNLDEYAHLFGSYLALKYRVDFGAAAFYSRDYTIASIYGDSLYRDTNIGGMFMVGYPFSVFSRAGLNTYLSSVERKPLDSEGRPISGKSVSRFSVVIPQLSYTFDNILWGLTGPLNGMRYETKLVFSPPLDLVRESFVSWDVDFRRYFHLFRRFVWANKVAMGFSVPLEQDRSGRRFFLGGNENWIFFANDVNIENYEENIDNVFYSEYVVPFRGWEYFDLTGTRFAVLNTEFRFPFIREFSIVWPLPMAIRYINGALFTDIGNAWDSEDEFELIPLPEKIYGGLGFGLRANLGIFVLRFDRAWQTDWATYVAHPKSYVSLGAEF